MSDSPSPEVVCDLRALTDRQRKAQLVTSIDLIVPDGFELQFEPEPNRLVELAQWVERESMCCAWLDFAILRSPSGPLRLRLTSSAAGAKETISAGLQAAAALAQGGAVPTELAAPTRTLSSADFARIGTGGCAPACGCGSGAAA
jgi:hypothetical protein